MNVEVFCFDAVAPVRERGLKPAEYLKHHTYRHVAPVRERGLKRNHAVPRLKNLKCRSREGAWIETSIESSRATDCKKSLP